MRADGEKREPAVLYCIVPLLYPAISVLADFGHIHFTLLSPSLPQQTYILSLAYCRWLPGGEVDISVGSGTVN